MENLEITHYQNGDPIPHVPDEIEWRNLSGDAYCNYENSEINVITYGMLYNLHAVNDDRGICPKGWHVPTAAEWNQLNTFLGGSDAAGGKLKEAGTAHWRDSNV